MRFNFNVEDIKYVKVLYKDSNNEPAVVKAGIKRINEREIIACAKFDEKMSHIATQDVVISFVCVDGLYRTKTFLKSVENAEPYLVLILQTPQGLEYQQNREYFRIPVKYDCVCIMNDTHMIEEIDGKTLDLSANGVCVIFHKPFIPASEILLRLFIENRIVEIKSRYVRSEAFNDELKVSFEFVGISDLDRDYLSQICIKKQLEQKRNSLY